MASITIDNSKESAVGGSWENPGATMYDQILESSNWQSLLKEAYLIAPISKVQNTEEDKTSFSASDMGYPHHVIRNGKLVLHTTGLRAAFSRGEQQGIVSGEVETHLVRHYKEMGWYEESSISEDVEQSELSDTVKNALAHFGILGMRWGVRREVGPDGLIKGSSVLSKKVKIGSSKKEMVSRDYARKVESLKKKMSQLSNEDLRVLRDRLQLEQSVSRLKAAAKESGKGIVSRLKTSLMQRSIKEVVRSGVYHQTPDWQKVMSESIGEAISPPKKKK